MPAGSTEGGRWTDGGGSLSGDDAGNDGTQLAQADGEDVLNSHIIRNHVAKTDAELIARIEQSQYRGLFVTVGIDRNGTFVSFDTARDFIRRTLDHNDIVVEQVARGELPEAFLTWRFGYRTGREAIMDPIDSPIRIRPTYMVGVEIVHDPTKAQGYRIVTAYPRNYNERIGR